jgi:hypothetical protein
MKTGKPKKPYNPNAGCARNPVEANLCVRPDYGVFAPITVCSPLQAVLRNRGDGIKIFFFFRQE